MAVIAQKATSALELPERLEPPAGRLVELDPSDRDLIIRAVQTSSPRRKLRGVSWELLEKLKG